MKQELVTCEVTRGFAAAGVEVLIVGVDRNREHAARPPFKSMFLLAVALPDRGGAVAFGDVDHFFVHMFLRFGLAACGNFTDIAVVGAAGSVEYNEGTWYAF
jgi:hypothetical protein